MIDGATQVAGGIDPPLGQSPARLDMRICDLGYQHGSDYRSLQGPFHYMDGFVFAPQIPYDGEPTER